MIVAHAPVRISFGGGGTDLPAYYEPFGGLVVSAAISPRCIATIVPRTGAGVLLTSADYGLSVAISPHDLRNIAEPLSLPRAVLSWYATRGLVADGIQIKTRAEVPPGSGLGSSSAMAVALAIALARHFALPITPRRAAEIACEVELDLLARPIGRQDQYAAAVGGLNRIEFSRSSVTVTPLPLGQPTLAALRDHLLLVPTRQTRDSATVLGPQRAATAEDGRVVERLHQIKRLAEGMANALTLGDLVNFGSLLHESWQLKRGLVHGVSSNAIDRWYDIARNAGAYGGKICGAGGGGFFLFCVPPHRRSAVIGALGAVGLKPRPFSFDSEGVVVAIADAAGDPAGSAGRGALV
jgi:D-glycero-alpha-D-manno-heptose-7-phosphate kinase